MVLIDQLEVHFCLALRYQLQEQRESLNTSKEQLVDIKDQPQSEVQKKAKVEFSLRRVEEKNFKFVNQVDDLNGCSIVLGLS